MIAGFTVSAASSAEDGLERLRTITPDVIVLDLGMPRGRMQGIEMLAQLRETAAWREIPVIILSAYGDIVNRDVAERLGVVAILSKPLADIGVLVAKIRGLASGRSQA